MDFDNFKVGNLEKNTLNYLSKTVNDHNVAKGWRDNSNKIKAVLQEHAPELIPLFEGYLTAAMIALIHSELSEALEADRKNLMDDHLTNRKGIEVELADAQIRINDLCGYKGLDLGGAVVDKFEYNKHRADHKKENRAKENGKKY